MHTQPIPALEELDIGASLSGTGRVRRWYVLALLTVIYALSSLDRQLPFILAEPIRHELGLSDGQLGLIGGLGFSIVYTILCLPVAYLADRTSRKWVLTGAVALWSAMTAASGQATNFLQLFLARIGLGVGEAGCSAPSHAIITEMFPPGRRAMALSIFATGSTAGISLGFWLGGMLADTIGWRATYGVFGAIGILIAMVAALTLPRSGGAQQASGIAPRGMMRTVRALGVDPTFRNLILGAGLHALTFTALVAWSSPFLMRVHGLSTSQAGLVVGTLAGIAGTAGLLLGGGIADRIGGDDRRGLFIVAILSAALSIPFATFGLFAPTPLLALVGFLPAMIVSTAYAGPVFAAAQELAAPDERATAAALLVLMMGLFGVGVGPTAAGYLSDAFAPFLGDRSIQMALALLMLVDVAATLFLWLSWRSFKRRRREPADRRSASDMSVGHGR